MNILTRGDAVADFFSANLFFEEGLEEPTPFVPADFQREILDLVYEVEEDGRRKWRTVLLGIPRGNGKSPLASGIGEFELMDRSDAPTIFVAAAAKEQAGIVHGFAYDFVNNGPLSDYIALPRVKGALGPLKCDYNGGVLRVVSADGDLQQGLRPSVVIIDELHVFKTGKQLALYDAFDTAMHKRKDSLLLIITTAGDDKASSLLGQKYEAMMATSELEYRRDGCLTIGRNHEARSLLIWYGAPEEADASDPAVWRACNPAPWISDEELKLAALTKPESVFRRYYLNQWVLGDDAAIQPAAWDACRRHATPIPSGHDVWVGVDIGERRDHSAIVVAHPRPSGRVQVEALVLDPGVEHVKSLLPMIEAELRRLADTYQVRAVAYDKWQMNDLANRLASEGLRMVEYPQNDSHMVPASQDLLDRINARQVMHDGDKTLRTHVLNGAALITSRGGWRFAKPVNKGGRVDEKRKVDALLALTMAVAAWRLDAGETETAGDGSLILNW